MKPDCAGWGCGRERRPSPGVWGGNLHAGLKPPRTYWASHVPGPESRVGLFSIKPRPHQRPPQSAVTVPICQKQKLSGGKVSRPPQATRACPEVPDSSPGRRVAWEMRLRWPRTPSLFFRSRSPGWAARDSTQPLPRPTQNPTLRSQESQLARGSVGGLGYCPRCPLPAPSELDTQSLPRWSTPPPAHHDLAVRRSAPAGSELCVTQRSEVSAAPSALAPPRPAPASRATLGPPLRPGG